MAGQGKNHLGETCAENYTREMNELFAKLEMLKAHFTESQIPAETAHWGNAGSIAHINELLDEILIFEGLKEDGE